MTNKLRAIVARLNSALVKGTSHSSEKDIAPVVSDATVQECWVNSPLVREPSPQEMEMIGRIIAQGRSPYGYCDKARSGLDR